MYLELRNADIGYSTPLIKNATASLNLGDICLLVGNNGVGKTTLIKSLLNQQKLLCGEIYIDNHPISTLSAIQTAEKIAVVFSKGTVPQNLKVIDLITLGKYIHYPYYFKISGDHQAEVKKIIRDLDLERYTEYHLTELSDGNLQKAFIGRALAQNSPVIILDEPTTHLDEENTVRILSILRSLAKNQKKLILFSSHDWRLAKEFADKMWYVSEHTLYSGTTEDVLLRHPQLLRPKLFHLGEGFIPPKISAPQPEKEMMYSFLQKHFPSNLTDLEFSFENGSWMLQRGNKKLSFSLLEELLDKSRFSL